MSCARLSERLRGSSSARLTLSSQTSVAMQALLAVIFGAVFTLQGCGGCAVVDGFDPEGDEYKNSDLGKCTKEAQDDAAKHMAAEDAEKTCKSYQALYDCMADCCEIKAKDSDQTAAESTKEGVKMMNDADNGYCKDHKVTDPCA